MQSLQLQDHEQLQDADQHLRYFACVIRDAYLRFWYSQHLISQNESIETFSISEQLNSRILFCSESTISNGIDNMQDCDYQAKTKFGRALKIWLLFCYGGSLASSPKNWPAKLPLHESGSQLASPSKHNLNLVVPSSVLFQAFYNRTVILLPNSETRQDIISSILHQDSNLTSKFRNKMKEKQRRDLQFYTVIQELQL